MSKSLSILLLMGLIGLGFAMWIVPVWDYREEINTEIQELVFIHESSTQLVEQACNCQIIKIAEERIYLKLNDLTAPNRSWANYRTQSVCGLIVTGFKVEKVNILKNSTQVFGYPFTSKDCVKLKSINSSFFQVE